MNLWVGWYGGQFPPKGGFVFIPCYCTPLAVFPTPEAGLIEPYHTSWSPDVDTIWHKYNKETRSLSVQTPAPINGRPIIPLPKLIPLITPTKYIIYTDWCYSDWWLISAVICSISCLFHCTLFSMLTTLKWQDMGDYLQLSN